MEKKSFGFKAKVSERVFRRPFSQKGRMKHLLHEQKAQAGFEYIIILAGAILIALIIGAALKAMGNVLFQRGQQLSSGNP